MITPRHVEAGALRVTRARLHPRSGRLTVLAALSTPSPGRRAVRLSLDPQADLGTMEARAFIERAGARSPIEVLGLRALDAVEDGETERRAARLKARRARLEQITALGLEALRATWACVDPPLSAWTQFFEMYRGEQAHLETERLRLERSQASAQRDAMVEVDLRVPAAPAGARLLVEVDFHTESASWRPALELEAEPGPGPDAASLRWTLLAELRGSTGHLWDSTELILDDAEPPIIEPPPELRRVVLSGFQGPPLGESTRLERPAQPELRLGPARRFSPPAPVTFEEHRGAHRVAVLERRAEGALTLALDLERPSAVHRWLTTRPPLDLASVNTRIFWRGALVRSGPSPALRSDRSLELDLGPAEGLSVQGCRARRPPRRSRGTNRLEHVFEVELTLTDAGAGPVDLELRGRLPLAGSRDVEVELIELPEGSRVDPETGELDAVLRLAAGARRTVRAAFSVHAPRAVVVDEPEPR